MLDTLPDAGQAALRHSTQNQNDDSDSVRGENAAWQDSDDERLMISLASNSRLRKLRVNESEDVVNGKEYTKRLRRQYEILHPRPKWVTQATTEANSRHKRRRLNADGSEISEDNDSSDPMSEDGDDFAAQPLAELLQGSNLLASTSQAGSNVRNKIRSEIIDMHRLKDIGGTQNVSFVILRFFSLKTRKKSSLQLLEGSALTEFLFLKTSVFHLQSCISSTSSSNPCLHWRLLDSLTIPPVSINSESKPAAHNPSRT